MHEETRRGDWERRYKGATQPVLKEVRKGLGACLDAQRRCWRRERDRPAKIAGRLRFFARVRLHNL